MKTTFIKKSLLLLAGLFSGCLLPAFAEGITIIPRPNEVTLKKGGFRLTKNICVGYSSKTLKPAAEYLADWLAKASGNKVTTAFKTGDILLSLNTADKRNWGAYTLTVGTSSVKIAGNNYNGVISGIESFRQLFPSAAEAGKGEWSVPCVVVSDVPRYQWRGFMLDVARHFYSKQEVKELLDLMALYKLNKFHWHLTDDQGWRVEIKKYPLLTQKGAWRTFNNHDRDCMVREKEQDNPDFRIPAEKMRIENGDTLYGGYYTQEDIKEIVRYAGIRGIDIIPEIDMPGHMLAAITNYKGLSCTDQIGWGKTFTSPLCPGKDRVIEFCQDIYKEIFQLFPYNYVHIGGDEVEKDNWKKCPDCQKRMKEHGLKTEAQLQAWFTHTMEEFFNKNGRDMIGWDEIVEGGLSKTSTVMWWRNWAPLSVPEATAHGNDVILCPNANFYFDALPDKYSVQNLYDYDTGFSKLPLTQRKHIAGVQGNLWTEWIPTRERAQYLAFPRLLALSELGWTKDANKNWNDFQKRMVAHFSRLNALNVNYRLPDLEGFYNTNAFTDKDTVAVTAIDPELDIRYTTDGSVPSLSSAKYEKPFTITESTDFAFRTFGKNVRKGDIVKTRFVKQNYAPAVDVVRFQEGLDVAWYDYAGEKCAEIDSAPFKKNFVTKGVVIPDGAKGNIGLVFDGYIWVPEDSVYTFALLSDDGSVLEVAGETVVDNDFGHSPREITGQKALKRGLHPLKARYFDHNGGILRLRVLDPKGKELPADKLFFRR